MTDPAALAAGWLHENCIVPLLWHADMMQWEDTAYGWILFALYGVAQLAATLAICAPLERLRPLEHWPSRRGIGTDILYTLLSRIGLMPLLNFVLFYQAQTWLSGILTDNGYVPPTLERWFPALLGKPLLTFAIYVLLLDFADYWRHRLSHRFHRWYALHAVHHAQEKLTFWSDDRNHLLDDTISYCWFLAVGLAIGIPPMQFPLAILLLRFLESLSHANARLSFGWLGERLLVSPRFHRAHHGILAAGERSCNYGAIFPFWDMLFRTADFSKTFAKTGDPEAPRAMAEGGWLLQQIAGLKTLISKKESSFLKEISKELSSVGKVAP